MVLPNRRLTIKDLADDVGISKVSVKIILKKKLGSQTRKVLISAEIGKFFRKNSAHESRPAHLSFPNP